MVCIMLELELLFHYRYLQDVTKSYPCTELRAVHYNQCKI